MHMGSIHVNVLGGGDTHAYTHTHARAHTHKQTQTHSHHGQKQFKKPVGWHVPGLKWYPNFMHLQKHLTSMLYYKKPIRMH